MRSVELPPYRLRTLGGISLDRGERGPGGDFSGQRKALALLTLLAASPAGISREKVSAFLWPESGADQARNVLSQLLHRIRRELGPDVIVGTATLTLSPLQLSSDHADLDRALADGDVESADRLYRGRFLDGFHLRDAPEFERWVDDEGARLHRCTLELILGEAESRFKSRDLVAAQRWSRRSAELDPLSARAATLLLDSLEAAGDREGALRLGHAYSAIVRAELGVEPSDQFQARLARLRNGTSSSAASRDIAIESTATPGEPDSVAPVVTSPRSPPASASEGGVAPRVGRDVDVRRRRVLSVVVSAGTLLLVFTLLAFRSKAAQEGIAGKEPHLEPRRVVVADFENRTGDRSLDPLGPMLADWVTRGLQGSGIGDVIDPDSRLAVARRVGPVRDSGERSLQVARLAREAGAGTVVTGAIYRDGQSLYYSASVSDAETGRLRIAPEQVAAPSADPVSGASGLRDRLAGALAWAFDVRVPSLSSRGDRPPLFDAYREFMRGMDAFQVEQYGVALEHFQASVRLDSTFATPLVWSIWAANMGGDRKARSVALEQLARRRERLQPLDRLALDYFEAGDQHDEGRENEALFAAARLSPGSAWGFNAGMAAVRKNRLREGLQYFERMDPEHGWVRAWPHYWKNLLNTYHLLGEYEKELATIKLRDRLISPTEDPPWSRLLVTLYRARSLTALGRPGEALQLLVGVPFWQSTRDIPSLLFHGALELRTHGYDAESRVAFTRLLEWCHSSEAKAWADSVPARSGERRLDLLIQEAKTLHELERWDDTRAVLRTIGKRVPTDPSLVRNLAAVQGLLAARWNDRATALTSREQLDHSVNDGRNPTEALIESAQISELLGDRAGALRRLERLASINEDIGFLDLHRRFPMQALRADSRFMALAAPRE